ncbi:hypothetical protein SAMN05216241_103180 [Limimonas halophila]|uniref:Photolyase/cryptochrome alpha/beta domain-containing protein n=1 Tax=Limimonas halophila TaxID=1082479 RepID=A0A1G7Q3X5_9PROT|nr:FAD-dependent oxidoreductase [Limimonas halophila]SDF92310.1 hypothetical protein SAMN05216241_103180 [Limimonas halophila]
MPDAPIDRLPPRLASRTRALRAGEPGPRGAYVLYSLSGNLRGHENQALDAAVALGNALGLPVLAVFELSERYPFASDRHHRFVLEGAREALATIRERGIATAAYVHRPGAREEATPRLARDAAAVVCDDQPTRSYREDRSALLAATAERETPVLAVDASCVVPMIQVGRAFDRAYKFRSATKDQRADRLHAEFPPVAPRVAPDAGTLPRTPTDLDAWDLGELTAACEIDHSVPPVPDDPGGEAAAQTRWAAFRDHRLAGYAARRNDALQDGAVSHLSPYLRHGMIAATQLAREAAAQGGKGPEKFLEELLIWREMAWSFAHFAPDHDTVDVLPDWARESLDRCALDPRPALYVWETLARGRTDDAFWNAAQAGYLRRGYLHNNVRMTWGKALLPWTEGPDVAARMLVDLNNRYALDGGDPNSYAGLFWCLGAFDRPFDPEKPIFGRVRPRSTEVHAERLDTARFAALQTRRPAGEMPRVAVIGAGPAGLMCARTLADQGVAVTVLDKGRRVGGRTAAKRLWADVHADHGAPWFRADDPRLAPFVESWLDQGVILPWDPELTGDDGRYVPVPHSRALAEHLAADLDVRSGVRVDRLTRDAGAWSLTTDAGVFGPFDRVVVAVPAPQAAELLAPCPALAEAARGVRYAPCITAMARFAAPVSGVPDVVRGNGPARMAIRNSAKPGREMNEEVWVLHGDPAWSAEHLDDDADAAAGELVAAFRQRVEAPEPVAVTGHRWRYARAETPLDAGCLFDGDAGVGACGEWCLGGGIDDALLSGMAMAGRVFASEPDIAARGAPRTVAATEPIE